jgi:hypothetical protein
MRASLLSGERESARRLGKPPPEGEASAEELQDSSVLGLMATIDLDDGDFAEAQTAVTRLPPGFDRTFLSAAVALASGDGSNEGRLGMLAAYELATTDDERSRVLFSLARMGESPLPDEAALNESEERATLILAMRDAARGLVDDAVRRLRPWQASSREGALLLADLYLQRGEPVAASDVLVQAGHALHEPMLVMEAAGVAYSSGDLSGAKSLAEETLGVAGDSGPARRRALQLSAQLALQSQDWIAAEQFARALVVDDDDDPAFRWALVIALENQMRFEDAWHASRAGQLPPRNLLEAIAFVELASRFGSEADVDRLLDLLDEYESEEFSARVLGTVLQITRESDGESPRAERFRASVDRFCATYPESPLFRRIEFASIDELIQLFGDLLAPGAAEFEALKRSVAKSEQPYVSLALSQGRSYVSAILQRAAGCVPICDIAPGSLEAELEVVRAHLDGVVVVDGSALVQLGYLRDRWPTVVGSFRRLVLTEDARRDVEVCAREMETASTDSIGWDANSGQPTIHETPEDVLAMLRDRSGWIRSRASECEIAPTTAITFMEDTDIPQLRAVLTTLECARERAIAVYSDDLITRISARALGIPTFGTVALLLELGGRGAISASDVSESLKALRREFSVDLPADSEHIVSLAEERDWASGPALLAFARPALWMLGPSTLALFKACAARAFERDPRNLSRWLTAGCHGLASMGPPARAGSVAANLLVVAQQIAGADPAIFPDLLAAARDAAASFGVENPDQAILQTYRADLVKAIGEEQGVRAFLAITAQLVGSARDAARLVAFGTGSSCD